LKIAQGNILDEYGILGVLENGMEKDILLYGNPPVRDFEQIATELGCMAAEMQQREGCIHCAL